MGTTEPTTRNAYGWVMIVATVLLLATSLGCGKAEVGCFPCPIWRDGKCGYIDKTGSRVIPARFDDASSFSEGDRKSVV